MSSNTLFVFGLLTSVLLPLSAGCNQPSQPITPSAPVAQVTALPSSNPVPAAVPKPPVDRQPLLTGLTSTAYWIDSDKTIQLPLHFPSKVSPKYLRVQRDHPNGTSVDVVFDKEIVPLPIERKEGFEEYGDLKTGYLMQIGEYDFDGDGTPELLITTGEKKTSYENSITVQVVRYHAPEKREEAGRTENWELVAVLKGIDQGKSASLEENAISFPYGSAGLFTMFACVKTPLGNQFIEVDTEHGAFRSDRAAK